MASDLSWKPGPPPLDVPGVYVVQRPPMIGLSKVYSDGKSDTYVSEWQAIPHHFGPIPSPPSGEIASRIRKELGHA